MDMFIKSIFKTINICKLFDNLSQLTNIPLFIHSRKTSFILSYVISILLIVVLFQIHLLEGATRLVMNFLLYFHPPVFATTRKH